MSENKEDFVSFEKALRELKLRSEELKKLVSEGEIRAFRDGDSMKFRKEDVAALSARSKGEDELAFVDSLEDDTGMVTEQLSEEDTLIAEEEEVEKKPRRTGVAPTRVRTGAAVVAGGPVAREPGWVTVAAILGAVVMIWGFMICYSVAQESSPGTNLFTKVFAAAKK